MFDINLWFDGHIDECVGKINNQYDLILHLDDLITDDTNKKIRFLTAIEQKNIDIDQFVWLKLISHDDNAQIFEYFYCKNPSFFITEERLYDVYEYLKFFPAVSWAFCKYHTNVNKNPNYNYNDLGMFTVAVNYCKQNITMIKQIWNVPIAFKFSVINEIIPVSYELFTTDDIIYGLKKLQGANIPLLPIITKYDFSLYWNRECQVKLLQEIPLSTNTKIDYEDLISRSMIYFSPAVQRIIWENLNTSELIFFDNLDWSKINIDIVPSFTYIDDMVYKMLVERNKFYDYEEKLISYCCNSCSSVVLTNCLNKGLFHFDDPILWEKTGFIDGFHAEMLKFWHDKLHLLETDDFAKIRKLLRDNLDNLITTVPPTHQIFQILLSKQRKYRLDIRVRRYLYQHIPSVINLDLYTILGRTTLDYLKDTEIISIKFAKKVIIDVLNKKIDQKYLNYISKFCWSKVELSIDSAKILVKKYSNALKPNVLSELSYKINTLNGRQTVFLPSLTEYLQYVAANYGIRQQIAEIIIREPPIKLNLTNSPNNITEICNIYEHYCKLGLKSMLSIDSSLKDHLASYTNLYTVKNMLASNFSELDI